MKYLQHTMERRKRLKWIVFPFLFVLFLVLVLRTFYFSGIETEKDSFRRIRERGFLVALTDVNSLNYYIYRGEPMGYQLELLRSFSEYIGVPLKIIVANDIRKLYYYLDLNVADILALKIPVTYDGKKLVRLTHPFGTSRMMLIQRKQDVAKSRSGVKFIRSYKDFNRDTIYIQRNPFASPLFKNFLRRAGRNVYLAEVDDRNQEELVRKVAEGKIRFTVCSENLANVMVQVYSNIDAGFEVSRDYEYAWGTGTASDTLQAKINDWLDEIIKNKDLNEIYNNYYENQRVVNAFNSDYFSLKKGKLSPYDDLLRELSKRIRWDWRLLASVVYEESNFYTGQVSVHNASGLMQLMPETAGKYGIDSASSPKQQLMAGVKYLEYLNKQLPSEITDPKERINFLLASFNVGPGRVLAARSKAAANGKNPNKWNNSVDYYLTRKSKKDPVAPADTGIDLSPYGTAGGYVARVLERYYHYKNIIPE